MNCLLRFDCDHLLLPLSSKDVLYATKALWSHLTSGVLVCTPVSILQHIAHSWSLCSFSQQEVVLGQSLGSP